MRAQARKLATAVAETARAEAEAARRAAQAEADAARRAGETAARAGAPAIAPADPAHDREAKRLLELASGRYQNHFLTERNISNVRIEPPIGDLLVADGGVAHRTFEEIANVQFLLAEDHAAVRL